MSGMTTGSDRSTKPRSTKRSVLKMGLSHMKPAAVSTGDDPECHELRRFLLLVQPIAVL
jgi:hypothetical protein